MTDLTTIPPLPDRPADGHKGTFGTVLVVGGSETMLGAPALCARAALRSGVGLVKVACPPSIVPNVLTIEPSATGVALPDEPDAALAQIDRADPDAKAVLAVGPGLGTSSDRGELVEALLRSDRAMVLDADGLNLLAKRDAAIPSAAQRSAPLILTPHPGEYRRLAEALDLDTDPVDPDKRIDAATRLAERLNCVVVLKGKHTVIADRRRYAINATGNVAMATAGSGDVLTGLIAGLLAQGVAAYDAARLGAHLHGKAGDHWAQRHGDRGLRAIELADALRDAMQAHGNADSEHGSG
jgi:NAD(P)H-hydrate epimerase